MRIGKRYITLREGSIAWHARNFLAYVLFLVVWSAALLIAGALRFGWPF